MVISSLPPLVFPTVYIKYFHICPTGDSRFCFGTRENDQSESSSSFRDRPLWSSPRQPGLQRTSQVERRREVRHRWTRWKLSRFRSVPFLFWFISFLRASAFLHQHFRYAKHHQRRILLSIFQARTPETRLAWSESWDSRWAWRRTGRAPRPSPSWTPRKRSCSARTPRAPSTTSPTSPSPARRRPKARPRASWTARCEAFTRSGRRIKARFTDG